MKTKQALILAGLALDVLLPAFSTAEAQGTAFTYQGLLQSNGSPANGNYDFVFVLSNAPSGGAQVGNPVTNLDVGVSNGVFNTTLDFGAVFAGNAAWLAISVCTNGLGSFTLMTPLQELTPAPYGIFANTASNLSGMLPAAQISGTLTNGQLTYSSITVSAGTGLSGGGSVALGGSTTLTNVGVISVTGNPDITASTAAGAVTLASTATNINTPSAIVKRDGSGNFVAGTVTANLVGNATLASNVISGINVTNATISGNGNGLTNFNLAGSNAFVNNNIALGYEADFEGSAGNNVAIGYQAYIYGSGSNNIALGYQAGQNNLGGGNGNIDIGNPGSNFDNGVIRIGTSQSQAFIAGTIYGNGYGVTNFNLTGSNAFANNNIALGYQADFGVSGGNNVAIGYQALIAGTGSNNIALGYQAGYNNVFGGTGNIYIGSLGSNEDYGIIRIGASQSQAFIAGIINGNGGGLTNLNLTGTNVFVNNNISLGYQAGENSSGSGSNNIEIGNLGSNSDNHVIRLGTLGTQTSTYIAGIANSTISGGAAVYVNTSSGQLGVESSSARFKTDIQSMGNASEVLLALQPVTFKYKTELDAQGIPQFGLIAEQVEAVDPDLVVHDPEHGIYTVRYEAVNAMLLNEFLSVHRKIEQQNMEIQDLKQSVAELKRMVQSLAEKK